MGYYHNTLATEKGISGDDLNRRHRENRLGYAPAHESWADAGLEIRCIYPGQTITRVALDTRMIHVYEDLPIVG